MDFVQLPMKIAFLLVLFSIVSIFLASWAFNRRKRVAGAFELCLYMLSAGLYSLGYALEITSGTLEEIYWALKIQYLGIPFITLNFMFFVIRFVTEKPVNRFIVYPLLIIPLATVVLVFSTESHRLFYSEAFVNHMGRFPVFNYKAGPFYNIHFIHLVGLSIAAEVICVIGMVKKTGRKRIQIFLIFLSGMIPIITAVLTPERYNGVDVQPFSIGITGALLIVGLFRFKMLELVPKARDVAVDSISEMLVVIDEEYRIQDLNRALRESSFFDDLKIGDLFPVDKLLGSSLEELIEKDKRVDILERNFEFNVYDVYSAEDGLNGWVIIIRDITDTVKLMKELEAQASYDELTGLFNRRQILNLASRGLEKARRDGKNISIILMDLDNFKNINDTYGHLAGDFILKESADVLSAEMRVSDLIGRYGGEEFVIFCPDSDEATAYQIAERLRLSLESMNSEYDGSEIRLTASFGVASGIVNKTTSMNDFLIKADKALYKAKADGRNCVVVL